MTEDGTAVTKNNTDPRITAIDTRTELVIEISCQNSNNYRILEL